MTVTSTTQFASLLARSNLLTAEQLQSAQVELATAHESQLTQFVEAFTERGWISRWQGRMLLAGRHAFFLGRYKLLDHLGEGGMGSVLKAEQTPLGRLVAIKTLRKDLVSSPEMVARFHREIQAAAALSHPHIVAAYDADEVAGRHFLVMEYVEGRDLSQLVKGGKRLPIGEACEYIRQAALGLEHAHERGMVHRDIKPSNLLLRVESQGSRVEGRDFDSRPMVKILDMGLARIVQGHANEQTELTHTGQVVGTPDYISPEQARDTKSADIRSDIYSLGCSLYRLLTGKVPFSGEGAIAKITARLTDDVPQLRDALPDAPVELEAVLLQMMARDLGERYQTPGEVVRALTPFADVGVASQQVNEETARRDARLLQEAGHLPAPAPELNDFLNQLADEAAYEAEADTGTQELEQTQASGGRQPPDGSAPTMVFDPAINQPANAGRSPKISRAGRKLQEEIAERKRADRRKLSIGAAVVAGFIAVIVGLVAWQKAGETTLIVEWPLDERDGATIEIDGRAVTLGSEARLRFSGPQGQRTLKVTRDGYQPIESTLEFARAETKTFRPEWEPTAETARQEQLAALQRRVDAFLQASREVHPPGPDGGDKPRRSLDDPQATQLRSELIDFHSQHFATSAAVQSATLMSQLPWPIDALKVDDLEASEVKSAGISAGGTPPKGLIAILGDGRLKQWGQGAAIAISHDGKWCVSGGGREPLRSIWNTISGEKLHGFSVRGGQSGGAIAISSDQKLIAAAGSHSIALYDLSRRSVVRKFGLANTYCVTFSQDSSRVIAANSVGQIRMWETASGKLLSKIQSGKSHVNSISVDSSASRIACARGDGIAAIHDLKSGRELAQLEPEDRGFESNQLTCVRFNPQNSEVAVGGNIRHICMWNPDTGVCRKLGPTGDLTDFSFHPHRNVIAAAGTGCAIYDTKSGELLHQIQTEAYITDVDFSGDGETLATASFHKGSLHLWNTRTWKERIKPTGHRSAVTSVTVSPDGRSLATGSWDGTVRRWDIAASHETELIAFQNVAGWEANEIQFVGFRRFGAELVIVGSNGQAITRDIASGDSQWLRNETGTVRRAALSPDGARLVLDFLSNEESEVWDISSRQLLHRFPHTIDSSTFSNDANSLLTKHSAKGMSLWNLNNREEYRQQGISDAIFLPDGRFLLRRNRLYAIVDRFSDESEQRLIRIGQHGGYVTAVNNTASMVAELGSYGDLRIWKLNENDETLLLETRISMSNHRSIVTFTPDGRHLITANGNGTIYVLRLKEWSAE